VWVYTPAGGTPDSSQEIGLIDYLWITIILKMDDKAKYWLDLSDYDLETALAMLKNKRILLTRLNL
jgi:hypothetical protein